jgi:hypothetical protein
MIHAEIGDWSSQVRIRGKNRDLTRTKNAVAKLCYSEGDITIIVDDNRYEGRPLVEAHLSIDALRAILAVAELDRDAQPAVEITQG